MHHEIERAGLVPGTGSTHSGGMIMVDLPDVILQNDLSVPFIVTLVFRFLCLPKIPE